jgi:hypothetical protein
MLRSMSAWIYDRDPFQPLRWQDDLERFKARLAAGEDVFGAQGGRRCGGDATCACGAPASHAHATLHLSLVSDSGPHLLSGR